MRLKKGRRVIWIDREIQLRFVIFTLLALAITSAIVSVATFLNVWSNIYESIIKTGNFTSIYSLSIKKFFLPTIGLIFLLAVLACLGMVVLSHRVAGPAYRIIKILKELREGKNPDFRLRKGDALGPVVEELKNFAEYHKEIVESAAGVINIWKNTEVKDMSLNLSLKELENRLSQKQVIKRREEDEKKKQ